MRELSELLVNVIDDMASDNLIFSKEVQFQFELAWRIQKELCAEIEEGQFDILFEQQLIPKKYTDLIVRINENYYPIELKYKTADKEINYQYKDRCYTTYAQGAADVGCYSYLEDIFRIRQLRRVKLFGKYSFKEGFAIIMTNYPLYWGEGIHNNSNWVEFCLNSRKENKIEWKNKAPSKETEAALDFTEKIEEFEWREYNHNCEELKNGPKEKAHPIRYCIHKVMV